MRRLSLLEIVILVIILCTILFTSIPVLASWYQKQQYANGLKKAYTIFNEALEQVSLSKGCANDLKCTNLFAEGTTNKTFGDELVKYLKIKKNCSDIPGIGCFAKYTNQNYDGSSSKVYELDQWDGYRFITNDGMSFYIWNYAEDCSEDYSTGKTGNLKQVCGEIYVDINGPKKGPNYMGIDTFNLWISNGNGAILYPMGASDDGWGNEDWRWKNPDNNVILHCYPGDKTGWPCAGRIIEEGWMMKY